MRIWIDGYEANVPQRLGSSQVAFELLRNLEKVDRQNEYTVLLPRKPLSDLPKERPGWRYKVLRPGKLWTWIALPLALYTSRTKPDLFFSPTHYIPRFSPVKRVALIHDLSYLHFPGMFKREDLWKLTNWTKFSVTRTDHLIAVSNFTKQDLIKQYGVSKQKVTVAVNGYDKEVFHPIDDREKVDEVKNRYGVSGRYVIFVGTIQPRKNLLRLIEAFAKVGDLKLVIVGKITGRGKEGWLYKEILEKPKELGIEGRVVFTGFVPMEDLPYLYSGAESFILPSLWEGFGIPALEAMACGTPVIVSNVSSLPEVVGSAGVLVDPYSVEQITQAICTVAGDKKLQLKKSKEGLERVREFSWEKMARVVLKVFGEVGGVMEIRVMREAV